MGSDEPKNPYAPRGSDLGLPMEESAPAVARTSGATKWLVRTVWFTALEQAAREVEFAREELGAGLDASFLAERIRHLAKPCEQCGGEMLRAARRRPLLKRDVRCAHCSHPRPEYHR